MLEQSNMVSLNSVVTSEETSLLELSLYSWHYFLGYAKLKLMIQMIITSNYISCSKKLLKTRKIKSNIGYSWQHHRIFMTSPQGLDDVNTGSWWCQHWACMMLTKGFYDVNTLMMLTQDLDDVNTGFLW